jgi:superfamily II DNA or RNA helicase
MPTPRRLDRLDLDLEYRTGERSLVSDFYRPCLSASLKYDRASGYFRSTVFQAVGRSLLEFVSRGGRFRLICSPDLTEAEISAFQAGYQRRKDIIAGALDREVASLFENPLSQSHAQMIATMIACGAMDVRVAFRSDGRGIYHEKLGIFEDSQHNKLSFKGSGNETWSGWHESGNHESFDVFRSWGDLGEAGRVQRHAEYFDRLWKGLVVGLDVERFPDIVLQRLRSHAKKTLEELELPLMVGRRQLLTHQATALDIWRANGRRGILEHATGSGKTFTALNAIAQHLQDNKPVLVLVPSQLLLYQWLDELQSELPNAFILCAGAGKNGWQDSAKVEAFTDPDPELGPRVLLAMMQTARTEAFLNRIESSPDLLIVADEVHRTGSLENQQLFRIDAGSRLGLSATPDRFGDVDGTDALNTYFGPRIGKPFTLADAIASGRLCSYEYHAHRISLTEEEAQAWVDITKRINRELAQQGKEAGPFNSAQLSPQIKMLLIKRARLAKQAENKISAAERIMSKHFQSGDSWLVYCDDRKQLESVKERIEHLGIPVNEYHSGMVGSPSDTLRWYKRHGGILVSIRCLDEGIDIPEISHALILASSQNPREYIQRRGRVLRMPPPPSLKTTATVHDALVLPDSLADEPAQTSLVKSELARALEFANGAMNKTATSELLEIAIRLGIDIGGLKNAGLEDDNDDEPS